MENISLVKASYEVALLQIAKQKKPHTVAESLVKPCAIKMVGHMLGKQSSKMLEALSFFQVIPYSAVQPKRWMTFLLS